MEVFVKMEGMGKPGTDKTDTLMLGRFSMVCRDSHTYKAHPVPPLIVETPEEQALWDIGQAHKEERGRLSKLTLDKQAVSPNDLLQKLTDSPPARSLGISTASCLLREESTNSTARSSSR